MKKNNKIYLVKKGPADPFRGDWYIDEKTFDSAGDAISHAAELTLAEYNAYLLSWEQFGYEWSVFEKEEDVEKKIWEGYKYIRTAKNKSFDIEFGNIQ